MKLNYWTGHYWNLRSTFNSSFILFKERKREAMETSLFNRNDQTNDLVHAVSEVEEGRTQ